MAGIWRTPGAPQISIVCSREEAEVLLDYIRQAEPALSAHPALAWGLALEQALGHPAHAV